MDLVQFSTHYQQQMQQTDDNSSIIGEQKPETLYKLSELYIQIYSHKK